MSDKLYGVIEAGGTKFVCALLNEENKIVEKASFPTTLPEATLKATVDFFMPYKEKILSFGIGSFGPIDIHESSPQYGFITSTPKMGWKDCNFLGYMKRFFDVPMAWTTDVNASCVGEYRFGVGRDKQSIVYYTIGTGIGGGAIVGGKLVEGLNHPEMGHMLVRPVGGDKYPGNCSFHGQCLEGMASGPAIENRLGFRGQELEKDDPFWSIEANYIAQCIYNTTLMFSPEIVIIGGGVSHAPGLLHKVHTHFSAWLNGYIDTPTVEEYIVNPELGDNAAIYGCLAMAKELV